MVNKVNKISTLFLKLKTNFIFLLIYLFLNKCCKSGFIVKNVLDFIIFSLSCLHGGALIKQPHSPLFREIYLSFHLGQAMNNGLSSLFLPM